LGLFKTYLLAGYGSGHIRAFDISSKTLICEISAHAKWITSIDIALESGRVRMFQFLIKLPLFL